MKPLINLRSFLAVLLILIVPAALLVAYFRDYSPGAGGHEHGEKGKSGGAAMKMDDDKSEMKPGGDHAAMGHGNTAQPSTTQAHPQQTQATPQSGAAQAREHPGMAMFGTPPGIPGASHLYHLGATGFFLDHTQHLTLTTEQKKKLNQIKEQALLNKASAGRKVQEAEQQLWKSTASDKPNPSEIETKVREIGKLRVAQRLAFIRSVGEAAKVLTEEQKKILLGNAAPIRLDAKSVMPGSKPTAKPAAEPAHAHKP